MEKKLMFILNPHSGKGHIKTFLLDIIDIFTKHGWSVTVHPTQDKGDCAEMVKSSAKDYELIVISGGDGTLNEAVNGMISLPVKDRIPIGYIPSGTMNDFASGNGISKTMKDAAAEIMNGRLINYDIGVMNGQGFVYVAAFGAFTDVSYDTPQVTKNIFGNAAYVFEGIKRLPTVTGINITIETDEGDTFKQEVYLCLIMNSTSVAGFEVGEFYDVDTNDGLFEIVLIPKTSNLLDIASVITSIKNGETDKSGMHVITTRGARIRTDEGVRWTLDGEYGGESDKVDFKVIHSAVQFIVSK
ncbi:MAG: diacylglycerol kinase family lipid kinase [Clostridia bacterium]|nr:diacylglycerol kinase family lipid kinase [Clostridia bacterium]